jgi:hypothetical protein
VDNAFRTTATIYQRAGAGGKFIVQGSRGFERGSK